MCHLWEWGGDVRERLWEVQGLIWDLREWGGGIRERLWKVRYTTLGKPAAHNIAKAT